MRLLSIKEAFKNLWRNRLMSFASIGSVAATLLILGIVMMVILNINSLSEGVKHQFDTIEVFIEDDLSPSQIQNLEEQINNLQGIHSVIYETKEQALMNMKEEWGEYAYLLEDLEYNPLPNTYIVNITDLIYSDHVVANIETFEGVEDVKYYRDVIEKVLGITTVVRNFGLVLIIALIGLSTFIINNTIKLAINARRKEIQIMKYVGATSWYIRWPFVLEGTILGVFGAVLATGALYFIYNTLYNVFSSQFYMVIAIYIVNVDIILSQVLYMNMIIGAGIGALGSIFSIRKYLKV